MQQKNAIGTFFDFKMTLFDFLSPQGLQGFFHLVKGLFEQYVTEAAAEILPRGTSAFYYRQTTSSYSEAKTCEFSRNLKYQESLQKSSW